MTQMLIWFLGVILCGLSSAVFIASISLHKEALISYFFEKEFLVGAVFSIVAFVIDIISFVLFYAGYYIMEHNL